MIILSAAHGPAEIAFMLEAHGLDVASRQAKGAIDRMLELT
jgi:hypothetical protein